MYSATTGVGRPAAVAAASSRARDQATSSTRRSWSGSDRPGRGSMLKPSRMAVEGTPLGAGTGPGQTAGSVAAPAGRAALPDGRFVREAARQGRQTPANTTWWLLT